MRSSHIEENRVRKIRIWREQGFAGRRDSRAEWASEELVDRVGACAEKKV